MPNYRPYADLTHATECAGRLIALGRAGEFYSKSAETTKCLFELTGSGIGQTVGEPEGVTPLFGGDDVELASFPEDQARELCGLLEAEEQKPQDKPTFGADAGFDWISILMPIAIAWLRKRLGI